MVRAILYFGTSLRINLQTIWKRKYEVDFWIRKTGKNAIICRINKTALIFVEETQFSKLFIASNRDLGNSIKIIKMSAVYKMERSNKFRNQQKIVRVEKDAIKNQTSLEEIQNATLNRQMKSIKEMFLAERLAFSQLTSN